MFMWVSTVAVCVGVDCVLEVCRVCVSKVGSVC